MFKRKQATNAGRTLNRWIESMTISDEVRDAIRLYQNIVFQYFLIPRDVREAHFRPELMDDRGLVEGDA